MKLKSFSGTEVYGYLNFRIEFFSDLSFLVGVNGSGKTTILRLIQALLTPSFRDLIVIPFSEASVVFEDRGRDFEISSRKVSGHLELRTSETQQTLTVPLIDHEELEVMLSREGRATDLFEEYQLKHSDNEVFQFITRLSAPVILGLERTHKTIAELPHELLYEREQMLAATARRSMRARRIVRGDTRRRINGNTGARPRCISPTAAY